MGVHFIHILHFCFVFYTDFPGFRCNVPYAIHWTWHLGEQQGLLLPGVSPMAALHSFISYKLCPRFLVLLHSPQHHGSHFALCQVGVFDGCVQGRGDFILPALITNWSMIFRKYELPSFFFKNEFLLCCPSQLQTSDPPASASVLGLQTSSTIPSSLCSLYLFSFPRLGV